MSDTVSLLDNILTWANENLPLWQLDALRRLFKKENLDPQDYDDLYALMKSAHGLSDPQNRKPNPISHEHISTQLDKSTPIILHALRDLKHVNRIAPGQKLEFSLKGITVIYGGNASGKSGYFRVLKQACRARDVLETILPDAFDPNTVGDVPEAIFDIEVGGNTTSLTWKRDATPPDELSTVAVFDNRCARVYLDDENDAAYIPYGLDIMKNLGQHVLPNLINRLNEEIDTVNTDITPFGDLQGETAVGKMIVSISAYTDPQKVTSLATLTSEELNRFNQLGKTLAETDPKAKAKALRLSAQRIKELITRIDTAISCVNDDAIEKIKAYDTEAEDASRAEAIAVNNFQAGEKLLPGTGEQAWKNLFEAAKRFSTEIAYRSKTFPHVVQDAKCTLCQQPLDSESAKRMQRFNDFVNQDIAKVVAEKREKREKASQKIKVTAISFGLDTAIMEEVNQLDASIPQVTQHFERKVEARRVWLLETLNTHTWDATPPLDSDPRPKLNALSKELIAQAENLDKVGDENQKKVFETEYEELKVRIALSQRLQAILGLIQRMKKKESLIKCKDELSTRSISNKAKEFASKAVTNALKSALDTEFKVLGVGHIKTKLNDRVEHGKVKHKLVLDLPTKNNLNEILSEGEQRAIAIGSFLAELHLAEHQGGIVFDDPVSSLDHLWRKNVASRLVEEAKKRQVIVLTHDTVFLGELRDQIEQQKVECLIQHLDWINNKYPGNVKEGLPWEHKSYKDRLDNHEKAQRTLERTLPAYLNEEGRNKIRREYGLLRSTIERIIEDVVFNRVVQRYRDWIRVDQLKEVVGFTDVEYNEIAQLHKACCDVVDTHDPSSAKNAPVPNAKQLGSDIAALKKVVETIKTRRKSQKKG